MKAPPGLVIFDCDGVLVDSEPITCRLIAEEATRIGVPMDAVDAIGLFAGGRWAHVLTELERRLGQAIPEGFTTRFRERLVSVLEAEVEAVPGVAGMLEELGLARCVASNGPQRKMQATLGRTGLLPHFEGRIFSAYDIDCFKPDPGLFLHAARQMGVAPAECVVVEDSALGVQAGVAAGMRTFAFSVPEKVPALVALGAEPLADMRDLPSLLRR